MHHCLDDHGGFQHKDRAHQVVSPARNVKPSPEVRSVAVAGSIVLKAAGETVLNTEKANKELFKANDYNASYGLLWAILFFTLGMALLILDFLKS